jgi:hypothetical protein
VAELTVLNEGDSLGVRAFTFDGDTPGDARKAVHARGEEHAVLAMFEVPCYLLRSSVPTRDP